MVALIFQNQQEIEKDGQKGYTLFISFQVYLDYILCSQKMGKLYTVSKNKTSN